MFSMPPHRHRVACVGRGMIHFDCMRIPSPPIVLCDSSSGSCCYVGLQPSSLERHGKKVIAVLFARSTPLIYSVRMVFGVCNGPAAFNQIDAMTLAFLAVLFTLANGKGLKPRRLTGVKRFKAHSTVMLARWCSICRGHLPDDRYSVPCFAPLDLTDSWCQ
nr:hypothetical protein CFP56_01385 [Quercus suber]